MNTEITIPQTLHEAMKHFADPETCHESAVTFRWPGGVTCPYCHGTAHSYISTRRTWACKSCKKRFTVKVGTIMEDSPLKLETWFAALWMIANAKNGISSCEIARALGVMQKTAWFLLHRIREAMQVGSIEKMSGSVEAGETFIGGLAKNMHKDKKKHVGTGAAGKEIVMGILERGKAKGDSKVHTKVIKSTNKQTIQAEVKAHVKPGASLFTEAHHGYQGLSAEYAHKWVDHAVKYAEGEVHTNGLENFWSLFQRMFGGTYTHMEPQHLAVYMDEMAFRFDNRPTNDAERSIGVLCSIVGKRLNYEQLVCRDLDTMMSA